MNGAWLLTPQALQALHDARRAPPSAERMAELEALAGRDSSPLSRAGDVAEISVSGVLMERLDWIGALMGGTSYASIRGALAQADADPAIREIVLNVNSPGGSVDGLFETIQALNSTKKPVRSRASLAASAAYALVAAAGPIEASGPAATFGSVGVATRVFVDDSVVDIASSAAPNKRPDPRTAEGKAVIQGELDAIHALLAGAIATGRSTDVSTVNAQYGRGGTLLAAAAKKAGMIDSISAAPRARRKAPAATVGAEPSASLKIHLGIDLTAAPGSQLEAAERMIAELDASETQDQRAARLLAEAKPPEPPKPDLQTQIADRLDYLRGKTKPVLKKGELPPAAAAALTQLQSLFQVRK